ncbi:MAG: excinuclease ABC subunit UvrA [Actinobacteria bacterium]|jgi:excinuclease ABC subunit A|nr:excinuclease ABC subunit UvrA [Actinomycetota bacterium]
MGANEIVILGAREHNLKDISLTLPRDRFIAITGLSGSGKSSLAFDTIYAEGQRRYVESLSAYARQFLGQMSKPDVDSIEGLSPAISIDQKTTSRNPRSTVGTVTEVYDYLRLLYARIGRPHCWICGRPIEGQSKEQIVDQILGLEPDTRFVIKAPVVRGQKGWHKDVLDHIRQEGFTRVEIDGTQYSLDEPLPDLEKNVRHDVSIVVDRLVMKEGVRRRLSDSVETALSEAQGLIVVDVYGGNGGTGDSGGRGEDVAVVSTGPGVLTSLLFSENLACPEHGVSLPEMAPRIFSFNTPHGACETCSGLGAHREIDPALLVGDPSLSVAEGVLLPWSNSGSNYYEQVIKAIGERYEIDMSTPWGELPTEVQDIFLYGTQGDRLYITWEARGGFRRSYMTDFEGIVRNLERRYRETDSDYIRERIDQYMSDRPCPACNGARLKPASLAVRIGGLNIYELSLLPVTGVMKFLDELQLNERDRLIGARVLKEIKERLAFLEAVGVGYLSLQRSAGTLSGGEAQRIRLATQIGSSLVGVLYILDEPSIGLHQRDNRKLIDTLIRLRDLGNTVIVVEHDEETIRSADFIVDMGPGAGEHGGEVVESGSLEDILAEPRSITGQFLSGRRTIPVPATRRPGRSRFVVRGAREHNLKDLDVAIPTGAFVCVTGVSGSGKSTLVNEIIYRSLSNLVNRVPKRPGAHDGIDGIEQLDKVIAIDQSPIGRTPRSNPATYTGVWDHIRQLYSHTLEAKVRGYMPGRFSFNVKGGRCEACKGDGTLKIEMHFLPDIYVPCDVCQGKRYNRETLEVRFKGKNVAEVLDMSVEEAVEFFTNQPKIRRRLQTLADVGLGYIRLGQSSTTLSGGEAQRVKLATELAKIATGNTLYILDEPTTGLHFADIDKLLEVLQRLVDSGNTVLVIEHNLDVIKCADWIIDLGPEGGDAGGELVSEGTPEDVCADPGSETGKVLARILSVDDGVLSGKGARGAA